MCCAHFNSNPVTTSIALRPTPLNNPDSVAHARPVISIACARPTAIHFGTTVIKMRYARRAFRASQQPVGPYGLIRTVRTTRCVPVECARFGPQPPANNGSDPATCRELPMAPGFTNRDLARPLVFNRYVRRCLALGIPAYAPWDVEGISVPVEAAAHSRLMSLTIFRRSSVSPHFFRPADPFSRGGHNAQTVGSAYHNVHFTTTGDKCLGFAVSPMPAGHILAQTVG